MRYLLVALLLISTAILNSCAVGGWQKVKSLKANDFFTDEMIEIPIGFKYGSFGGITTAIAGSFSTSELAEMIRTASTDDITYTVYEYPNDILLIGTEQLGRKKAIIMLAKDDDYETNEKYPHAYVFFSPYIHSWQDSNVKVFFPLHLVSDKRLTSCYDSFVFSGTLINEKYATNYGQEDFLSFYKEIVKDYYPIYDPETIQVIENGFILNSLCVQGRKSVTVQFYNEEGKNYFTMQ